MPKRVTSQEGNIELILADSASNIDLNNDTSFTGVVNVGPYLDVDGATGTVVIRDINSLSYAASTPGGEPVTDPQIGNVTLLISAENEASGTGTFTSDIGNHVFTPTTAFGGRAEISDTVSKFGTNSLWLLDSGGGTDGHYTCPNDGSFNFAGDDFTVEFHVYFPDGSLPSAAGQIEVWDNATSQSSWRVQLTCTASGAGGLQQVAATASTTGTNQFSIGTYALTPTGYDQWHHVAVVREGTNVHFFVDGVLLGTSGLIGSSVLYSGTRVLLIGGGAHERYFDNIRITKGVARYTTGFTPPTAPFEGSYAQEVLQVGDTTHARVEIADGVGLRVNDAGGTDNVQFSHDGTDFNITGTNTTDLNFTGFTAVNVNGSYLDLQEIADPAFGADAARGKLWVRDDAPNTLVFTDDAGTDFDVAGAGVIQNRTYTDIAYSTPPSGGTPTGSWQIWDSDNTDQLATFGYEADPELLIKNYIQGSDVEIRGIDIVGTEKTMAYFQVDGPTTLYNNGTAVAATTGSGIEALGIVASLPSTGLPQATQYVLANSGGSDIGYLRFPSTAELTVDNLVYGGPVQLRATPTAGGSLVDLFSADADDTTLIYAGGVEGLRLTGASSSVIQTHEANVGLTADVGSAQGSGVITSSYNVYSTVANPGDAATLPSTFPVGTIIYVKNDGANPMDVFPASGDDAGEGVDAPVVVQSSSSVTFIATAADSTWTPIISSSAGAVSPVYEIDVNDTFDSANAGKLWHKDSGGAVTFTCDNDSSIQQGTMWLVHNDDTEDLTIAQGTGVTISFLASGAAPVTGNVTVEQGGFVTVYKYTDTEYWVWGDDGPFNLVTAGATTDSTLRWDGTSWIENTTIQATSAGSLYLAEQTDASADIAGYGQLWVDLATPNILNFTDDTGQDIQISPNRATVQTTDATQTEIISIPIASGTMSGFEIHLSGHESATGDSVFERVFGAIRNQGGTTALVGSTVVDRTADTGAAAWTITVAADDGTDALTVDVTGEASHTIDWKVSVEVLGV